jgi:hypothetical protein
VWTVTPEFTYGRLHLLRPRCGEAIRFLMYLLRIQEKGQVVRVTDSYLAKRFLRAPATIARWRAWLERLCILHTHQDHGQATQYVVDLEALRRALQQVEAEQERLEQQRRNQRLLQEIEHQEQIDDKLRQLCDLSFSITDQDDRFEPINMGGTYTDSENRFLVNTIREDWSDSATDALTGDLPVMHLQQLDGEAAQGLTTAQPNSLSTPPNETRATQSRTRTYFLEVAKRLVEQSGQRWNRALTRLLEGLETDRLIRAVTAFWEQCLRGNVRNASAWLTRAVQRGYRATKRFVIPDGLPHEKPSGSPEPWRSASALRQSPYAQESWYQSYVRQYDQEPRIEETEDGLAVLWGSKFIPLSWLRAQEL